MREIVIVIADLYLQPDARHPSLAAEQAAPPAPAPGESPSASPGIERLARFGAKARLPEGWRAWLARWLGLPQCAPRTPASVAAAALEGVPAGHAVWLATPLHLVAGLVSLHFDRRSLLRPAREELEALAADFREVFRGSGFDLRVLDSGEFLLSGAAAAAPSITTEPARLLLTSVAEALPLGEGAPALRRLGAEIEMWLHAHPLNERRARRGVPPISTLWVWGGGGPAASAAPAPQDLTDVAYGSDAYLRGLWRIAGGESRPMPVDWTAVFGEPRARRALCVVEVAELLHAHPEWSLADAVAELDGRIVSPSLDALHRGQLDRLVLVANDRRLTLRAADRWRLWRRRRAGLEGLT